MTNRAQEVQDSINKLQEEMHKEVALSDADYNTKRDKLFSERREKIAAMIADKAMPANFWALALISAMQKIDKENETTPHFLGPYDEKLLSTYMTDLNVEFKPSGYKVTLTFAPNPFFEETELWAECVETAIDDDDDDDEEDEEDEEEATGEAWEFSGLTWKAGHGPLDADDDEESDDEDAPGKKRQREAKTDKGDASNRGPSLLDVFSQMSPPPGQDEEDDDLDEDELADAQDMWEEEMEDRHTLMDVLVGMIFFNPWEAMKKEEAGDAKKAKTE